MDIKVYHKETVKQPQGDIELFRPDIVDIYPKFSDTNPLELTGAELLEGQHEVEQALILSTIYQKGQDPVALEEGTNWAELMLGEMSALQIITQVQAAVAEVSSTASVTFTTIQGKDGKERLAYTVRAV